MKKKILASFIISSAFIINGCNMFSSNDTKYTPNSSKKSNYYSEVKDVQIPENSYLKLTIDTKYDVDYLDIVDSKDGKFFTIKNGIITFKKLPDYNNPQDSNRDNIYEVEVYMVDKEKNDFFILFRVKVLKATDKVQKEPVKEETPDNNDQDNDYIPDNIEKLIGYDSNNSDQNHNGIIDGLEGDEFFNKQWYILATGTVTNPSNIASIKGNDLNLLKTYKNYMGHGSIIQIVDSGIDSHHEDLKDNMDISRSLDGDKQGDPVPGGMFKPHGTMLAGIAAARAFNNVGIRGVAPFAKIAGSNWLAKQSLDGLAKAWYSGAGANEITVTNNSWGSYYTADTIYEDIMQKSVTKLRDGKGRIFVFASGNAREQKADANIQYVLNNRYALVVGALNYKNNVANYSTPGANLWTVAYGGADDVNDGPTIATTFLTGESKVTWDSDTKKNYTYAMAGSSAAAPMVSGAIALIIEACPNLTYRDVKYLIATTAKKVDSNNPSWLTNDAGYSFSRDYGFGLINTQAVINKCTNSYKLLPTQQSTKIEKTKLNKTVSIDDTEYLDIEKDMKVEWVELNIDINSENASDIDIYLESPSGTKILLIKSGTIIDQYHIPYKNWMNGGFRFSTGAMLDESSAGEWKIEIDNHNQTDITLNSVALTIYGYKGE
jgi:kexin